MASRGIRIESVSSQIGAMGGSSFRVEKSKLMQGLRRRYDASQNEAEHAIKRAIDIGAVQEGEDGTVSLCRN